MNNLSRNLQLLVLTAVELASIYTRSTLGPLQEAAKASLKLTDSQMALVQGPALAFPMLAAGVLIGLAVDRTSRARLLLILTIINVAGTIATAFAPDFSTLLLSRASVGITAPAALIAIRSILGDAYPPDQRGRALMIVAMGGVFGMSAAFWSGGTVLALLGPDPEAWRRALLFLAIPPAIAALLALRIHEPERSTVYESQLTVRAQFAEVWRHRALVLPLLAGTAVAAVPDGAVLTWTAPTLSREFGLGPAAVGALVGAILLIMGLAGPLVGGTLSDLCNRARGPRGMLWLMVWLSVLVTLTAPFSIMPSVPLFTVMLAAFMVLGSAFNVSLSTTVLVAIPGEVRGVTMGLLSTTGTLFGLGVGPVLVTALSASVAPLHDIGTSLAVVCAATSAAGVLAIGAALVLYPRKEPARVAC